MQGDEEAVRLFLDHGASPNSKAHSNNLYGAITALDYASKYGHLSIVELLIERGAKIDQELMSPLLFAAEGNQAEIIKFLLEKGINCPSYFPNKVDLNTDPIFIAVQAGAVDALKVLCANRGGLKDSELAKSFDLLAFGVISGKMEMVQFLVEQNVLINHPAIPSGSYTALTFAIEKEDIAIVNFLLAHGAKIEGPEPKNGDPWSIACRTGNPQIIEILLKYSKRDINELLFTAVSEGKLNVVKMLLEKGGDVNCRERISRQPLIFKAVKWPAILQLLVDKKVNINPVFDGGNSALHIACLECVPDSISVLLKAGAKINEKNSSGATPLHLACSSWGVFDQQSREKTIIFLLENGADPNITTQLSSALLNLLNSFVQTDLSVIKQFVKCGVDLNAFDSNRCCALDYAIRNIEILDYLLNEGANVNIKPPTQYVMTPFLRAVDSGNLKAMELLVSKGANVNAKDRYGRSALDLARQHHQELVQWLIVHGAK